MQFSLRRLLMVVAMFAVALGLASSVIRSDIPATTYVLWLGALAVSILGLSIWGGLFDKPVDFAIILFALLQVVLLGSLLLRMLWR